MRHLLVFLVLSGLRVDAQGIEGQLQLTVDCFHHPSRVDRWGNRCDILSDCDPHFRFCLTDVDPTTGKCRLTSKKFDFENHVMLGTCAKGHATKNFPTVINFAVKSPRRQLLLVLTINEQNKYSGNKLIDELLLPIIPGVKTVANGSGKPSSMTPLKISSRVFTNHDKPRVELSALLRCAKNRYGPSCSVVCVPNDRYSCLEDGSRRCSPGWRSKDCNSIDHCSLMPCKDWATCRHVNNTFQCECDGRIGPQCRAGLDPCLNHRCAHGATCVSHDDWPKCQCAPGWLGRLCTQQDPCTQPDACGPQGRCSVMTSDDGHVHALCDCLPGWTGPKCREVVPTTTTTVRPTTTLSERAQPVVKKSSTAIIIIAILSVLLLCLLTVGAVVLFRWRRKRKRKRYMHRHIVQGNPSYHVNKRQSSAYDSTYEDPDNILAFDSGIYAEPGVVYSCIDLTERDGTVESELPPQTPLYHPESRSLANSVSSVSSSRAGVRYVRANVQQQ